jgi:integrase
MTKKRKKKNVKQVDSLKTPGYHCIGDGLYLQVRNESSRSWIYRYQLANERRDMGLGSADVVTLSEARDVAHEARKLAKAGKDPIQAREDARAAQRLLDARSITFKDAAQQFINSRLETWKNAKHKYQWNQSLETFAYPIFGNLPVGTIDTALVTNALQPIWLTKAETATRLRTRIEKVLDWAKVSGYRDGENPARWRGHLDKVLPANPKSKRVKHLAALPFREIGAFMQALKEEDGNAARALEFTILTAARTGEVLGAQWSEIDLANKLWVVPAERMKAGKAHRVPLSPAALDVLKKMDKVRDGPFIFPGARSGKPLSNMSMLMMLRRMGRDDLTTHGFRSSFRDWAAECTTYPREVCEMALAHQIPDAVEAAYRRGELLEKRRGLASDWARYCSRPAPQNGKVVSIRGRQ